MADQTELTVKFVPPAPDAPGYIDRLERALDFKDAIDAGKMNGNVVRNLVAFLVDYVPGDRALAEKAIRAASEKEFSAMLNAVSGVTAQVPPEK